MLFYASQKMLTKPSPNAALAARGKALYDKACVRCHDEHGHGDEELARVAGQQPVYLSQSLKRYRAGVGTRLNPRMAAST